MYHGHSSCLITCCIPSRTVDAECGSGEKLGLWEEANFSKGGFMCSCCPQWVEQKFWAMARKYRLGFMKKLQTVLQTAKYWHKITWKNGGITDPGAQSKAELPLPASWEVSRLDGFHLLSTHSHPIRSEFLFSTSFSLRTKVRGYMTNGAGTGRRGKEPLATEYGPREWHLFPSCKALQKFCSSVASSWHSVCVYLQSHVKDYTLNA